MTSPRTSRVSAAEGAPRLSEDQRDEFIELVGGADSVELKLTLPDEDHRSTVAALGMDPLDAYLRQVFFLETPDLALDGAGVVVRARRSQGRPDDTVVKLRPVVPDELPAKLRKQDTFGVEVDAMPGGFVCSASFKGEVKAGKVKEAMAGERPLRKLYSKAQRAFFEEHAPDGVAFDDLRMLGPITVLKLKYRPADLDQKLVAELWLYPDGSRILELSTKCKPVGAFEVAAESREYLAGKGVELEGEQATKTRTALEFFSRELTG